jgi:hypothetical protein
MKYKLAMVRNVMALRDAFESLSGRDQGIPGMGLVHGFSGAGKTTAVAWLVNRQQGVYVRACATWTPSALLGAMMGELGAAPLGASARMVAHIAGELGRTSRPLFVDEADYLLRDPRMLETLRDIHDVSGAPVILVGMEGIDRRLVHRQQLARRISHWVEFRPLDRDDARVLAETVCEVSVSPDLLASLHAQAKGSVGLMVVGLARIEAFGRANGLSSVDAGQWGEEPFFLARRAA